MQRDIIRDTANIISEQYPELGNIIRDTNNDFFKTRANDTSLNSNFCLTNARIKSFILTSAVKSKITRRSGETIKSNNVSMNHEGRCYQTNGTLVTLSPGEAEEHQAS